MSDPFKAFSAYSPHIVPRTVPAGMVANLSKSFTYSEAVGSLFPF